MPIVLEVCRSGCLTSQSFLNEAPAEALSFAPASFICGQKQLFLQKGIFRMPYDELLDHASNPSQSWPSYDHHLMAGIVPRSLMRRELGISSREVIATQIGQLVRSNDRIRFVLINKPSDVDSTLSSPRKLILKAKYLVRSFSASYIASSAGDDGRAALHTPPCAYSGEAARTGGPRRVRQPCHLESRRRQVALWI